MGESQVEGRGRSRLVEALVGIALLLLAGLGVSWLARDPSETKGAGPGPVTSSAGPGGPAIVDLDPGAPPAPGAGPLSRPLPPGGPGPDVVMGGPGGPGPHGVIVAASGPDPVDPDAPANASTGVRGRVVLQGQPVAGATVSLRGTRPGAGGMTMMIMKKNEDGEMEVSSPGETRSRSATTAADGTFEVRGLDASYRYELVARPGADAVGLLPAKRGAPKLTQGAIADAGDVALRRGATVSGVVSDPDGRPLANALVRLGDDGMTMFSGPGDDEGEVEGKASGGVAVRRSVTVAARPAGPMGGSDEEDGPGPKFAFPGERSTRTDEAGRYVLDRLAPGKHTLTASSRGLRASKAEVALAEGEQATRDIRLAPPLAMSVRVTDPSGTPIQGASVQVSAGFGPPGRGGGAVTDTSGTAVVRGLSSSEVMLSVAAEGYATVAQQVQLGAGDPDTPRLVVLRTGAVVTGRVVRTDGTPVKGAMVFCEPAVHGGDVNVVAGDDQRSGDDGRFTVKGVAPGEWRLRAHAPHLAQGTHAFAVPEAGGDVDVGDVKLADLGTVEVTVQDPDGAVAEGAVVEAGRGDGMMMAVMVSTEDGEGPPGFAGMGTQGKTDAQGVGKVGNLQPGRYTVRATKAGFADGWGEVEIAGGAEPARVTVRLTRGATIAVRVTGKGGRAAPAKVGLWLERKGRHGPVAQAVAVNGSATFERIAPGEYRVMAEASAMGGEPGPSDWFRVEDGATASRSVEVDLGVTVEGVVRRAGGDPVPDAALVLGGLDLWHPGEPSVAFAMNKATTDATGRFRFEGVRGGQPNLGVSVTVEGRTSSFRLEVGDDDVRRDLTLAPPEATGGVRARAVSAVAAGPAVGATLSIERVDAGAPLVRRELTAGPDGSATFESLPDGRYVLSASAPGLARSRVEVLVAGALVEAPALSLDRGVSLLLDLPPGRPGAEARVMVRPVGGADSTDFRFASAELGRPLRIEGLASDAEHDVRVDADGFATWTAKLRGAVDPTPTRVDLRPE